MSIAYQHDLVEVAVFGLGQEEEPVFLLDQGHSSDQNTTRLWHVNTYSVRLENENLPETIIR